MFHLVARGADGRLLFRTWPEAARLWSVLWTAVPDGVAATLMPDHLHLVAPADVRAALAQALAGYGRWRNHTRGESGPVIEPLPAAEALVDRDKLRRTVRYVHLNPCRAQLVRDPLAWPFSTHRDAVGLACPPVVRPRPDPAGFHAYVSGDPSVDVGGTPLPDYTRSTADPEAVLRAVSALWRAPRSALARRGPARTAFLRASRALCPTAGPEVVAALAGTSRSAVFRAAHGDVDLEPIRRALGDDRFAALGDGDLRRAPRWERYRGR